MKKYWKYLIGVLAVLTAGYGYLVKSVVPRYVEQLLPQVEKQSQEYLNGSVKIGGLEWNGGLTAEIKDIVVLDQQQAKVAELPRTVVSLKPWKALEKPAAAVSRVELEKPVVYLNMNEKQRWNMQDLLKPSDSDETPFYGLLQVKEGTLKVNTPFGHWNYGVEAAVDGGANPKFDLKALLSDDQDRLELKGLVDTKGVGQLTLTSKTLQLQPYGSVAKYYADIRELGGTIKDLALKVDNDGKRVQLSGEATAQKLSGKLLFNGKEHTAVVDAQMKCENNLLSVKGLEALVDQQKLYLEGQLDVTDWEKPAGSGVLTAPQITYAEETVKNLRVAFNAGKDMVQVTEASGEYGEGSFKGSATVDVPKLAAAGNLELKNISYALEKNPANTVNLNGSLALVAKQEQDNSLTIHGAADTFALSWKNLLVDRFDFDGNYKNNQLNIEHLSMFSENGSMMAKGFLKEQGDLKLEGRMAHFPIHPFLEAAGVNASKGYCSTIFAIGGNVQAPAFESAVQLLDADIMGQKIKEAHGRVALKDNILTFKKLKAHMEKGRHILDGTINLQGAEPVFDLSLETNGVRMEPIMQLVAPDVALTGNVDNLMEIQGTPSKPVIRGELNLTDGSANNFYLLDQVQGRYYYDDGQLLLKQVKVRSLGAEVDIDGSMLGTQRKLDFDIAAKNIQLNNLPIQEQGVELEGMVDFTGKLSGTMAAPYFEGEVQSQQLSINQETISSLKGKLTSNTTTMNHLEVSFEQPYKQNNLKKGLYEADVNLNLKEKFLDGNVHIQDGDLGGILRLCKKDFALEGELDGDIAICPRGKGSGIDIKAQLAPIKIHDQVYEGMDFTGRFKDYVLYLDDVTLYEKAAVKDKGVLKATGQVNTKQQLLDIVVDATDINPALVTAVMKDPPKISGDTDLALRLSGSYADLRTLQGSAVVNITKGSIAGVEADDATAMMTIADDTIQLKKLIATKDIYFVGAEGQIPLDLFREKDKRYNPQAEMNILVDLNNARLGILPALSKWIEWGVGDIKGAITIGGTLETPMLYGSAKIDEGSVKIKGLDTVIDKIHLDAEFLGNRIELKDLSTQLGKGKLSLDGSYALRTVEGEEYRLHLLADNAQLASTIFSGRINGELEIIPQRYRDFKNAKGNRFPPAGYRPLFKGNIRLDDVLLNIATVPEFGEGESNYGLDLKLELGPRIHMLNSMLYDIWLKGGVEMKGSTAFPVLTGRIYSEKGSVSYLRTDFKLEDASLAWINPGTFLPYVKLNGKARFSRYNIFMNIDGPVDTMDLKLTSHPELNQNTIIRMLTLQRDTAGSNDVSNDDMNNVMIAGLQMTVLGDVEMLIKQTLGLDQFRIYNGKVRSGLGFENSTALNRELTEDEKKQYNILASKFVTSHIQLGYSTSMDNEHSSIFGQYEFSRKFNITYSHSKDVNETEDWYGLEYQINF